MVNSLTRRVAVAVTALLLAAVLPTITRAAECTRVPTPDLVDAWIFSVTRSDGSILAVDAPRKRVVKVSESGSITDTFGSLASHDPDAGFTPVVIQKLGDEQFLLGNGPWGLVEVSPGAVQSYGGRFAPDERDLQAVSAPTPNLITRNNLGRIIGLFNWAATEDGNVLAFADVAHPDGSYTRGLVWFPWSNPAKFKIVKEVEKKSIEATFYFVLHPSITAIGDKAYFLAMEHSPTIYEYDGERLRALGMPNMFRSRPFVPEKQGAGTIPDIYDEIEEATTPIALYGWKGDLWLLGRSPRVQGDTHWTLSRVRPSNDKPEYESKLLYTLHLPTTKEHLAIATPGDSDEWIVLEKRSVLELGRQPIESMLRIPAAWFMDGATSPLRRLNLRLCRTIR